MHHVNDGGKEWMFGTTRCNKITQTGDFLYVFRFDLDSDWNPRADNLEVFHLDRDAWDDDSHVTGLRPVMTGNKIWMILINGTDRQLRFMEFDFTKTTHKHILINSNVEDKPASVFIGTGSQTVDGIQVFESYTAMTSKDYESTSSTIQFGKFTGAIYPSLKDGNSCAPSYTGSVLSTGPYDHDYDSIDMHFE